MKIMKIQVDRYLLLITSLFVLGVYSAPTKTDTRQSKSLTYFDYIQAEEDGDLQNYIDETDDDSTSDYNENELSRMIPTKRRIFNNKPLFNSPIYYIRLPPQPYMFVPGLGYVSQPAHTGAGSLLNLPVNFISNGKPGTIYQWNGGINEFATPIKSAHISSTSKPKLKPSDSSIYRLPGKYVFNGKPNDIYVLNDSYNSIYGDALQNFYP